MKPLNIKLVIASMYLFMFVMCSMLFIDDPMSVVPLLLITELVVIYHMIAVIMNGSKIKK